jgi:hypothetical protein
MLVALVGFALLALDGSRFMSLQTQMQAAADSLSLAGARELNQRAGAQARAINAMASASIGNTNTLSGMGTAPTFAYTYTFYQSLPTAATGFTGTVPTGSQEKQDIATKFVAVTITPVTIPTILPVRFLNSAATNHFTAGAQAIAGFTAVTVCEVTPIFLCNPYETSGMTDAAATQALISALDPNDPNFSAATLRRQLRSDRTSVNPGNFGWLQTADGCNNTSCMRTNLAATGGACYNSFLMNLATGNKNSVEQYFDTRFDIYNQSPAAAVSAANAPAVNVRKGYVPDAAKNWCSAQPDALAALNASAALTEAFYTSPMTTTTGTTTSGSTSITSVGSTTNIAAGEYVYGAGIAFGTTVTSITGSTVVISQAATGANTGLTFYLPTPATSAGLSSSFVTTNGSNSLTAVSISATGTTKNNKPTITAVTPAAFTGIWIGACVSGTNIPANATIVAFSSLNGTVDISPNATAAGTSVSLTFKACMPSVKEFIAGPGIPANTTVTAVTATTVTISSNANLTSATNANGGANLTFFWLESPLLQDEVWNGLCDSNGNNCKQGNGDWNCLLYWKANHLNAAAPSGCTSSNPTLSRYQVYRYEIANSLINDWSGNHSANTSGNTGNGESGAPLCAAAGSVSGVDTTTGGTDRRNVIIPIINCLAQKVSGSGQNAQVPAAAFGKFFMTQPWSAQSLLYGEMSGLVGVDDNVTFMNQVQLYR